MAGSVLVGTCNWADHAPFYPLGLPARDRLAYYARFFPLVEVDSTFYGIPPPRTTARWVAVTPDAFRFNVKAYRSLTGHEREGGRPREPTAAEVAAFAEALRPLREAGRLGAVHYQFPPWFPAGPGALAQLALLPERHPQDLVVVEMRHRSWGQPEVFAQLCDLLQESGLVYCVVDEPQLGSGSMPPLTAVTNPRLSLVRFHGRNRATWYHRGATSGERFNYRYRPDELRLWLDPIAALVAAAQEVHLLFNNNKENFAVLNALELAALLDLGLPPPAATVPGPAGPAVQPRLLADEPEP